ncbi:MAG: DUF5752 family protein [Desulfomonilaceae bacterium]
MNSTNGATQPFVVRDCALVAISTGKRAQNLREFRECMWHINEGSIYFHFWGSLLQPRFDDPQFNNDFANWSHYGLHDNILAERLAVIDPADFEDLEALRREILEVLEQRLDEVDHPAWVPIDRQFHFIRSQIVVFDTGWRIENPEELPDFVAKMSVGSIFYHVVDARARYPKRADDFQAWLLGFGDRFAPVCERLATIDPNFITLVELRRKLATALKKGFREAQQ